MSGTHVDRSRVRQVGRVGGGSPIWICQGSRASVPQAGLPGPRMRLCNADGGRPYRRCVAGFPVCLNTGPIH
mgnify:CR=1 FL=1